MGSSNNTGRGTNVGLHHHQQQQQQHQQHGMSGGSAVNALVVSELQEEKTRLLAALKAYEREFTKQHGRPVTKHEDIAPVSAEYKRYKEIKAILHES